MTIRKKTEQFFLSVLPEKLLKTLQDYDDFTANPAPNDIKSFGAYHLACKNALAHIVLLLRILQSNQVNAKDDQTTESWLMQAQIALAESKDDEEYRNINGICVDME